MKTKQIRTHKDLLRALRKRGIATQVTGGGHLRVECPDGPVFMGGTPTEGRRSILNAVAQLRRAGLDLEREP